MIANPIQLLCSAVLTTTLASADEVNAKAEGDDTTQRYSLLGLVDVCVGAPAETKGCDLRLPELPRPPAQPSQGTPEPTQAPELQPLQLTLFGKRLCIGDVAADAKCDWRLSPQKSA